MLHPNLRRLLPFAAFLFFACIAVIVWENQNKHRRELILRHTETSAEQIRIRIEGFMNARMASLEILARRWVERRPPDFSYQRFHQFAKALYVLYPGFTEINWIDPEGIAQWVFPEQDSKTLKRRIAFQHSDSQYYDALKKVEKENKRTVTPCIEIFQGGLGFNTFRPLIYDSKIQGYLNGVFQIEFIMDTCLTKNIQKDFWVRIYEDGRLVYMNGKMSNITHWENRQAESRTIRFPGKIWQLDLEPRAALYTPGGIRNFLLPAFGLAVAAVLALLLHLLFQRMEMHRFARDRALMEVNNRKQAEDALLESEKRFRNLVENALTGILIIQDDRIVYFNPEQERLFGPIRGFQKLTDINKNIHPDDIEKIKQFSQSITSGEVRCMETDIRFYPSNKLDRTSDIRWVHCMTTLIEYQGREAILFNMMDITRTKELEHLLRIRDKMTSLGRVAAGIAHEIRNPLSGINIYLNTLAKIYNRGDSPEKIKGIINQIQSASNKIESIIRRVMDFSKPNKPKFILTDINRPIKEAVSLSSGSLRKRGIEIKNILDKNLPQCLVDYQLMEQVFLNLITNAAESMKNTDGEKKIEIASSLNKTNIIVSVSDSGPGVPEAIADKVFDPFYTTKETSTGIGLSLCHRIVTDHGGSLTLSKSKLGGAKFEIEIPVEKGAQQR